MLAELRDAGFTGKLGLSVDKFHGIDTAKAGGVLPGRRGGCSAATTSCR